MTPDPVQIITSARSPIITTDQLSVHYERRPALVDVSIDVFAGETLSVLGPNGAGKSTLLKVIAGMLPPSHGSVSMDGEPLKGTNRRITYVPQRSGADWNFPISVIEAVLLGINRSTPRWRRFSRNDRARALTALSEVGMDSQANVQIGSLSGGQQQRVFLARALLQCGDVLLLDEPFSGVDVPTQEMFVRLFDDLGGRGTAIVYATHDLAQAQQTSDRVLLINQRLIAAGPPAEVMTAHYLHLTFGGQVIIMSHDVIAPDAPVDSTPAPIEIHA